MNCIVDKNYKNTKYYFSDFQIPELKNTKFLFIYTFEDFNEKFANKFAKEIAKNNIEKIYIDGSLSDKWKNIILKFNENLKNKIYTNDSFIQLTNELNMICYYNQDFEILVYAHEFSLLDMIINLNDLIFKRARGICPQDWSLIKKGYEFKYHNKDAIVVMTWNRVIAGFLGEEKEYSNFYDASCDPIFDGKSLYDLQYDTYLFL